MYSLVLHCVSLYFAAPCSPVDSPPDVTAMRCVPAVWCSPTRTAPTKVWDDTGGGGGKPGSVWIINQMHMVAFVQGHQAPTETFYDLNSDRFFAEGLQLTKTTF